MNERAKVVLLAASLVVASAAFALLDAASSRPADCSRELEDLLLSTADLPSGWTRGTPFQDDEFREGAYDSCGVTYYVPNGVANYVVNAYRDEKAASRGYELLAGSLRYDEDVPSLTQVPEGPFGADAALVECGTPRGTPICQSIARYGRYIVWFTAHVNPAFMTEADFLGLVDTIDYRMR